MKLSHQQITLITVKLENCASQKQAFAIAAEIVMHFYTKSFAVHSIGHRFGNAVLDYLEKESTKNV